jgi:hypothetical protein
VRAERRRTKKLIVAFHFQFSDPAAWKCDACRRSGLERKRRCGFIAEAERGARTVVWARKRAAAEECPKTLITAESLAQVEAFAAWKAIGGGRIEEMNARDVEARTILEREWRSEAEHGD